ERCGCHGHQGRKEDIARGRKLGTMVILAVYLRRLTWHQSIQDIERLYFSDDGDGAVAIIVYFTVDEIGQLVTGTGAVVFPGGAGFVTGENSDKIGSWLLPTQ